jgi:uncharacterized protein (TIGR02217 family)
VSFDEVQFPPEISMGSTGGPERQTSIVILGSGAEARNARWLNSRRSYDIGYGMRSDNDLHTVIAFFEARNARLRGFRFKDWSDYKSCGPTSTPSATDQPLGTGSITPMSYQLKKTYTSGSQSWVRTIMKPVAGTILAAVNGVATGAFTVDTTTGILTFTAPPAAGAVLTWGGEFDTPVRFDTDKLVINMRDYRAGQIQSIPLMELFDGT